MIDQRTRKTCRRKRNRGNVYVSAASSMSQATGDYIKAYKCAVCAH